MSRRPSRQHSSQRPAALIVAQDMVIVAGGVGYAGEPRVLDVLPAHHTPRYNPASSSAGEVPWTSL